MLKHNSVYQKNKNQYIKNLPVVALNKTILPVEQEYSFEFYSHLLNIPESNVETLKFNYILCKYLALIAKHYGGFNFNWAFMDADACLSDGNFDVSWQRMYKIRGFRMLHISKATFYKWYLDLTCFKDPKSLVNVIKYLIITTNLKRHKKVFYCVSSFLETWYLMLLKTKKIKGYSLFFKGKLAKKGSVRKNIFFCKKGLISFANKALRVNIRTYQLWTITGCMGAGISIFYNIYVYTSFFIHN